MASLNLQTSKIKGVMSMCDSFCDRTLVVRSENQKRMTKRIGEDMFKKVILGGQKEKDGNVSNRQAPRIIIQSYHGLRFENLNQ